VTLFLLDTSALLTLRDDEPGADVVAGLLNVARRSETSCLVCFISLMELYYRVWQDEGRAYGKLAYEQCLSLPISVVHEDAALLEKAAEVKATFRVSVADAWVAASAVLSNATLVHKGPELEALGIPQRRLPYK
jgi:ribonuclease VapC